MQRSPLNRVTSFYVHGVVLKDVKGGMGRGVANCLDGKSLGGC